MVERNCIAANLVDFWMSKISHSSKILSDPHGVWNLTRRCWRIEELSTALVRLVLGACYHVNCSWYEQRPTIELLNTFSGSGLVVGFSQWSGVYGHVSVGMVMAPLEALPMHWGIVCCCHPRTYSQFLEQMDLICCCQVCIMLPWVFMYSSNFLGLFN